MSELNKAHEQTSEYFVSQKYRDFETEMGSRGLNPRAFN